MSYDWDDRRTRLSHIPLVEINEDMDRMAREGQAVLLADYNTGDIVLGMCDRRRLDPWMAQVWISDHAREIHGVCAVFDQREGKVDVSGLHRLQMLRWEVEQGVLRDDGGPDWDRVLGTHAVSDICPEVMGMGD